jgi:hypothetical protein
MKLDDKIRDRKIVYLFRKRPEIAFELALLYFILAKRRNARKKILEACSKAIYWLKKASVKIPEYLKKLSPFGQLEEIESILMINKAKIGARACEPVYLPELCRQFGLA